MSEPIRGLMVSTLHPRYFAEVESFMRQHQVTVSYGSMGGCFLFLFPEGTVEEECRHHPKGEHWSTIKLPSRLKLIKRVLLPQEEDGPGQLILVLPNAAYGLKPQRKGEACRK